jgi:hypothetical protein
MNSLLSIVLLCVYIAYTAAAPDKFPGIPDVLVEDPVNPISATNSKGKLEVQWGSDFDGGFINGEIYWQKNRNRKGGLCDNHCSGHGTCEKNNNCNCFLGTDGNPEWTGPDCSLRTCPKDLAWVGAVNNNNDLHPSTECSNRGACDRKTGSCQCFPGYEGIACQRSTCPNACSGRGTCWPEKHLANKAGLTYDTPWDAMKHVGCECDKGYRGPACEFQECPSGPDPLDGFGNEAGRDCSGRGICNYADGTCACFSGFYGTKCDLQTTLF